MGITLWAINFGEKLKNKHTHIHTLRVAAAAAVAALDVYVSLHMRASMCA